MADREYEGGLYSPAERSCIAQSEAEALHVYAASIRCPDLREAALAWQQGHASSSPVSKLEAFRISRDVSRRAAFSATCLAERIQAVELHCLSVYNCAVFATGIGGGGRGRLDVEREGEQEEEREEEEQNALAEARQQCLAALEDLRSDEALRFALRRELGQESALSRLGACLGLGDARRRQEGELVFRFGRLARTMEAGTGVKAMWRPASAASAQDLRSAMQGAGLDVQSQPHLLPAALLAARWGWQVVQELHLLSVSGADLRVLESCCRKEVRLVRLEIDGVVPPVAGNGGDAGVEDSAVEEEANGLPEKRHTAPAMVSDAAAQLARSTTTTPLPHMAHGPATVDRRRTLPAGNAEGLVQGGGAGVEVLDSPPAGEAAAAAPAARPPGDEEVSRLLGALRRSPSLRALALRHATPGPAAATALAESALELKLRSLDLSHCPLGDALLCTFATVYGDGVLAWQQLKELRLRDTQLRLEAPDAAVALAALLAPWHLEALDLGANPLLNAAGMLQLERNCTRPCGLRSLDLGGCPIGNDGAGALANLAVGGHLPKLVRLHLAICGIGDAGAKRLADGLPHTSLGVLDFSGNAECGIRGLVALADEAWRTSWYFGSPPELRHNLLSEQPPEVELSENAQQLLRRIAWWNSLSTRSRDGAFGCFTLSGLAGGGALFAHYLWVAGAFFPWAFLPATLGFAVSVLGASQLLEATWSEFVAERLTPLPAAPGEQVPRGSEGASPRQRFVRKRKKLSG
eukprot:CAMPEP_0175649854 /NCGR_PEP_ID=MMETSP0097-20121207/9052_1 /TAXON_ID=311494 /ORGANISM="Alexandrium monilatum, Strain CCMP3105" /LENGTH=750 /DNA_ID=CAMNT_0016955797 /DNA_START=45 /DNA_END=2293 /DNA_ORIENTATION=+